MPGGAGAARGLRRGGPRPRRRRRRRPGVAPVGADPGDGGAVADSVRALDGDLVRAHLGRAVDPAPRLPDRVSFVHSFPGRRHGDREPPARARHAHAVADHGVAAVQAAAVRHRRRLDAGGPRPAPELRMTSPTTAVLHAIREGLLLVLLLSAPPLIASMVTGFVVGLFQAATHILDQTLAFVPKLVVV